MDRSFDYHFVLSFLFKSPEFETRILSKWFFHFLYERKSFENRQKCQPCSSNFEIFPTYDSKKI